MQGQALKRGPWNPHQTALHLKEDVGAGTALHLKEDVGAGAALQRCRGRYVLHEPLKGMQKESRLQVLRGKSVCTTDDLQTYNEIVFTKDHVKWLLVES